MLKFNVGLVEPYTEVVENVEHLLLESRRLIFQHTKEEIIKLGELHHQFVVELLTILPENVVETDQCTFEDML